MGVKKGDVKINIDDAIVEIPTSIAAIALRLKGLSQYQIAEKLQITQQAVSYCLKVSKIDGLDDFKKYKADILSLLQKNIFEEFFSETKIKAMNGRDLAFCLEKLNNMERLEREMSPQIKGREEINIKKQEFEKKKIELKAEIEKWENKKKQHKIQKVMLKEK